MNTKFHSALLLLLLGLGSTPLLASTYIGEYCWAQHNSDGIDRWFKLGFSNVGDGHYSVYGSWVKADLSRKSPVSGSAELIDGEWEISLFRSDSWAPGNIRFRAIHFDLDATNNGVSRWTLINDGGGTGSNEAPLSLINCSIVP